MGSQHPEVVDSLRRAYESWWASVSQHADEYHRIIIGHEEENLVALTCHDFHPPDESYPAWNQEMVRLNKNTNGFWALKVAKAGTYEFALQRWPNESQAALIGGVPAGQPVEGGNPYSPGKASPIQSARIKIGDMEKELAVNDADTSAVFQLDLPAGETDLQTWLIDKEGKATGAYYVYIQSLP